MVHHYDKNGYLLPGIHRVTWDEFLVMCGTNTHRLYLISGLKTAIRSLKIAGCRTIYIDGSFITIKEFPNDYDACWDISGVNPLLLDPILMKFDDGRAAMRIKYRGDLFPAQFSEGISGLTFLQFFQSNKINGEPKGIITLSLKDIS